MEGEAEDEDLEHFQDAPEEDQGENEGKVGESGGKEGVKVEVEVEGEEGPPSTAMITEEGKGRYNWRHRDPAYWLVNFLL